MKIVDLVAILLFCIIVELWVGDTVADASNVNKNFEYAKKQLPPRATNIQDEGNGWVYFQNGGGCFLYFAKGHIAGVTDTPCR